MDIYFRPTGTRRCPKPSKFLQEKHYIYSSTENLYHSGKLRCLSALKGNLKKYDYPVNVTANGIKKALEIPQYKLRKPNEKQTN